MPEVFIGADWHNTGLNHDPPLHRDLYNLLPILRLSAGVQPLRLRGLRLLLFNWWRQYDKHWQILVELVAAHPAE